MKTLFKNRKEAGTLLASKLKALKLDDPVVICIPRGGVDVALPIAKDLKAALYVILPRKLGAPFNKELAVGALAPDGSLFFDLFLMSLYDLTTEDLQPVIQEEKKEIAKRIKLYNPWDQLPDLTKHSVILVDDGIATGHTIKAALSSLKSKTTSSLILAVPVLPSNTIDDFSALVNCLLYLEAPFHFKAVGQYYEDFSDTSHHNILKMLEQINSPTGKYHLPNY
jgi:putative phosphoribosyl transferase